MLFQTDKRERKLHTYFAMTNLNANDCKSCRFAKQIRNMNRPY